MAADRLRFQTLPASAVGLSAVRLAAGEPLHLLVADDRQPGERQLLALDFRGGVLARPPARLATLEGRPDWDARRTEAGWQWVSVEAGSAVAHLVRQQEGGAPEPLEAPERRVIFVLPRFERGTEAISSIDLAQGRRITLHPPAAAPRGLASPAPDIVQAVQLLRWGSGHLLLVQTFRPGAHRVRADEQVQRTGVLTAQPLDAAFEPVGLPWQPLGERLVFEFAADSEGGRLALFAATPAGCAAGLGTEDDWRQGRVALAEAAWPAELSSPGVSVLAAGLRLVALEGAGRPDARLLLAEHN